MNDQHKEMEGQNRKELHFYGNFHHAQHLNDNSQADLCKESHSFPRNLSLQDCGDGDAKRHGNHVRNYQKLIPSHKQHTIQLGDSKLSQLYHGKKPLESPSSEFLWYETNCGWFILYQKNIDVNIHIRSLLPFSNKYALVLGEKTHIDFATLEDAVLAANAIAFIFKDSLPIIKGVVNTNATEPFNVAVKFW